MIGSCCATTRKEGIVPNATLLEGKKEDNKKKRLLLLRNGYKNIHICRLNQGTQNLGKQKEEDVCMLHASVSWWWIFSQGRRWDQVAEFFFCFRSRHMVAGQIMLVYHGGGQDCYQGKT